MPFGDGTGPLGQGPRIGRGMGRGRSRMRSNAGREVLVFAPLRNKSVSPDRDTMYFDGLSELRSANDETIIKGIC
jgi:hypothetical protein